MSRADAPRRGQACSHDSLSSIESADSSEAIKQKSTKEMEMNPRALSIFNRRLEDQESSPIEHQERDAELSTVAAMMDLAANSPTPSNLPEIRAPEGTEEAKDLTSAPECEQPPAFSLPKHRFTASWNFTGQSDQSQEQAHGAKWAKRRTRKSQTPAKNDVKIPQCRFAPASCTSRPVQATRAKVVMETPSVWEDGFLIAFLVAAFVALLWVIYEGADWYWDA